MLLCSTAFVYPHLLLSSIYILAFPFYHIGPRPMLKHVQEVFFFLFLAAVKKDIYHI